MTFSALGIRGEKKKQSAVQEPAQTTKVKLWQLVSWTKQGSLCGLLLFGVVQGPLRIVAIFGLGMFRAP